MERAVHERHRERRPEHGSDAYIAERPAHRDAAEPTPPSDHEQLVMHLERDQLVAATFTPVPRARLSPRVQIALWLLRAFAIVIGTMVIYTFIARL
jgi:hypothetical protein